MLHVAIYVESADHFTFVECSCGWPEPCAETIGPNCYTPRNAAQFRHEAEARFREHLSEAHAEFFSELLVEVPYAFSFPRVAPARRWWQRSRPLPPVPVWR